MDFCCISRRGFLKKSGLISLSPFLLPFTGKSLKPSAAKPEVYGHLWVYASQFPPDWDSTPIIEEIFQDFVYAGIEGIEIMDANLRNPSIVPLLRRLVDQYHIPVIGASYYADMWNRDLHAKIKKDAELVISRLGEVGGTRLGITVGDARRLKTERELDDQAVMLREIIALCRDHGVSPNLHNHTFEMENDQHDFRGTIKRVPEISLGPDINWLMRAGIEPVEFILEHRENIGFLHLRDQSDDGKWTHHLGQGVTDFEGIAKALKKIGFEGDVAIELAYEEKPDHPIREDFKKSREFVREVFGW